jgi:hypothetical protein
MCMQHHTYDTQFLDLGLQGGAEKAYPEENDARAPLSSPDAR